jgi:hypothetical protein
MRKALILVGVLITLLPTPGSAQEKGRIFTPKPAPAPLAAARPSYMYSSLRVVGTERPRGCTITSEDECFERICRQDLGPQAWLGEGACWPVLFGFACLFDCNVWRETAP